MKLGLKTIAFMMLSYGILVAAMYMFQEKLIFDPDTSRPNPAVAKLHGYDEVFYDTADGLRLMAWHAPAKADKATILMFHGKTGSMQDRVPRMSDYVAAGYGVFIAGYRGYNANPAAPSEQGLYRDGQAALTYLTSHDLKLNQIVLYGESLGTGVATQMASVHQTQGLILQAPFTSLAAAGQCNYPYLPVSKILHHRFDNAAKIK